MNGRSRCKRYLLVAVPVLAGVLFSASLALADALVVVTVKDGNQPVAADGQVTLEPRGEGRSYACTTASGVCRINGVAGGLYRVRFTPRGGTPTALRTVMIPSEGTVQLNVAAR
jgi:hypothetical protein